MKLLKVKPFQETLNAGMCGPATIKMVLDFYGINKTEKELAKLANTNSKVGTTNEDTIRVFKLFGLKCFRKNHSTLKDIDRWLKKGVPVIVDWFSHGRKDYPENEVADGHYSVAIGLDTKYIYLQDCEIGRMRKMKRKDFLKVWFDYTGEFLNSPKQMVIKEFIAVYKDKNKRARK